ncbi:disintegrin and metalloproteinase domain-containing protein 33 [Paramormyrops kingsleyae]|uniref:ADAM metallopeptidase domain 33 n=1 Tax=Paramormyrops kingsleyae TaxID=1676925 RepID=A0A3B3SLN5_9TELE|nr:disintegrin and metalloproteinase domain-containing protein 33-like [Paramormyrops kingsleyae]
MYSKHRQKRVRIAPTECGCRMILSVLLLYTILGTVNGHAAQGDRRGQSTVPRWISRGRTRRETAATAQDLFPDSGEIALTADGRDLVLQVERNHLLLGPDFTETHYSEDGLPVTLRPNHTDHCYYHGLVVGHADSWVALSVCSGVRGLIVLNMNDSYYLEPIRGLDSRHHVIYHTKHLEMQGGSCGHGQQTGHSGLFPSFLKPLHQRVRRNVWGTKYMELYIVADNMLYKRQNRDLGKTKQRIMEIANYVDKFYRALNIRVPLIGLEVWTDRDQCIVSEEPNATLWSFLQWRQKLKSRKKHDNAQLLTGVIFKGTTIGMAPLEGMCSHENSGGINVDHSELPIGAAATMAHEIGHNFGMSHDNEGCCVEATPEQGGCVMAAATGHPFPRVFSRCSKRDLENYFQKGGGMCLYNMPNMKDLVGGRRCGNGFVEEGEECDCGEQEECTNPCCHATNCTLKEDAQCAHGVCCEDCKLKQAGTMCRGPAGSCDLPEYCTGASPYCPSNVYLLDGSTCQGGHAYCYNGMCLTHEQQCLQLWGYGARPAHDACFQDVNAAGNAFGNCGKDGQGNYVKCEKSDAKCGKIQCHSAAKKPKGTNAVPIDTTIRTDGIEVKCRGTFVYSTQDGQGDLPDPGLVMTGTKCGEGKVCRDRRCQNASFVELEACIARCHSRGVCNSNRNCHCNRGWAPPLCEKPGLGGSVDSGPVQYDSQLGLVVGLLFAFLVLLPSVLILFCCCKVKTSPYHKWMSQREKNLKECRKDAAEQKVRNGHLNPAFHLKLVGSSGKNNTKKLPHTSKEVLPLRPPPVPNGNQPINIVRPLRPAPSPRVQREPQSPRPAIPVAKPPAAPARSPEVAQKLSPPRKPLPVIPSRAPLLVSGLRPIPSPSPPQRPLPLNPSRGVCPKPSGELLVMMPPTVGTKQVGTVSAMPPFKALRPVPPFKPAPGVKPSVPSSPFRK